MALTGGPIRAKTMIARAIPDNQCIVETSKMDEDWGLGSGLTFAIRTYWASASSGLVGVPEAGGRTLCERGREAWNWLQNEQAHDFETFNYDNGLFITFAEAEGATLFKLFWL